MSMELTWMEQAESDYWQKPNKEGICVGTAAGCPPCMKQCFDCFLDQRRRDERLKAQDEATSQALTAP